MKGFLIVIKTINVKQSELKNGIESSKCFFKGSIIDVRNEMPLQIVKLISESCIHVGSERRYQRLGNLTLYLNHFKDRPVTVKQTNTTKHFRF